MRNNIIQQIALSSGEFNLPPVHKILKIFVRNNPFYQEKRKLTPHDDAPPSVTFDEVIKKPLKQLTNPMY